MAFLSIARNDLPQLLGLVDDMLKKTRDPKHDEKPYPSVQLCASKALVERILNQETLSQLMLLCFNQQLASANAQSTIRDRYSGRYLEMEAMEPRNYFASPNFSTTYAQHAFLNRLINIGELCTGRYLAPNLQRLADRDFFQCLVNIRDALVHQDTAGNRMRVGSLLSSDLSLLKRVSQEMEKLYQYLVDLQLSVYQKTIHYDGDLNKFWKALYDESLHPKVQGETLTTMQQEILRKCGSTYNALLKDFFLGYAPLLANDEAEIQKLFRPKKWQDVQAEITRIRGKFPVLRINWKQAFPSLVELFNYFYNDRGNYWPAAELSIVARVNAALAEINNIAIAFNSFGISNFDGNPAHFKAWVAANKGKFEAISEPLSDNNIILNALQYNMGQCLQQVDTLREKVDDSIFSRWKLLGIGYELKVRPIRNYIIHGNRLLDPPLSRTRKFESINDIKADFIIHSAIFILIELQPELKALEQILLRQQQVLSPQPPLSSTGVINAISQTSTQATTSLRTTAMNNGAPIDNIEQMARQCFHPETWQKYEQYSRYNGLAGYMS